MKKYMLALILVGALCKPVVDASPLGIGGPTKGIPQELEQTDSEILDVDTVNKIVAVEMSAEEAMKELINVKIVETVKPDLWPVVGVITSDYGWRVMGRRREFHTGIDISTPYGTPVVASADGRVIYAGWIRGYGKTVIVYHGYGFATLYAHLSDIKVNYSDRVVKGQISGALTIKG